MQTKIEKLITESGLKQKFICDKIGISESILSRYKIGMKMTDRDEAALAEFFNVSREDIRGYVENPNQRRVVKLSAAR